MAPITGIVLARMEQLPVRAGVKKKEDKVMAMVNYSFQKNLKEQARKKKQEAKRLAKLNKKMAKLQETPASGETMPNQ